MKNVKTIISIIILLGSMKLNAYGQNYFEDVPQNHWAYRYISEMVENKYLSGYPDGKYRPDKLVTRAEIATLMLKVTGCTPKKPDKSTFADVNVGDWFCPFIETGKYYLTGFRKPDGSLQYFPNMPAKREDIAVAIVKLKGQESYIPDESILAAMFSDYDAISTDLRKYVAIALENNLISGYTDHTFKPQNSINRAEAAALLWKAIQGADGLKVAAVEINPIFTDVSQSFTPDLAKDDNNVGNEWPSKDQTHSSTEESTQDLSQTDVKLFIQSSVKSNISEITGEIISNEQDINIITEAIYEMFKEKISFNPLLINDNVRQKYNLEAGDQILKKLGNKYRGK